MISHVVGIPIIPRNNSEAQRFTRSFRRLVSLILVSCDDKSFLSSFVIRVTTYAWVCVTTLTSTNFRSRNSSEFTHFEEPPFREEVIHDTVILNRKIFRRIGQRTPSKPHPDVLLMIMCGGCFSDFSHKVSLPTKTSKHHKSVDRYYFSHHYPFLVPSSWRSFLEKSPSVLSQVSTFSFSWNGSVFWKVCRSASLLNRGRLMVRLVLPILLEWFLESGKRSLRNARLNVSVWQTKISFATSRKWMSGGTRWTTKYKKISVIPILPLVARQHHRQVHVMATCLCTHSRLLWVISWMHQAKLHMLVRVFVEAPLTWSAYPPRRSCWTRLRWTFLKMGVLQCGTPPGILLQAPIPCWPTRMLSLVWLMTSAKTAKICLLLRLRLPTKPLNVYIAAYFYALALKLPWTPSCRRRKSMYTRCSAPLISHFMYPQNKLGHWPFLSCQARFHLDQDIDLQERK